MPAVVRPPHCGDSSISYIDRFCTLFVSSAVLPATWKSCPLFRPVFTFLVFWHMSFRLESTFCPLSVKTSRGRYGCFVRPLGGGGGAKRGRRGVPALPLLTFGVSVLSISLLNTRFLNTLQLFSFTSVPFFGETQNENNSC